MENPPEQQNEPIMPEQQPEPAAPERPSFVTINTPLDRPEFDFFLTQYMNKLGLKDKKQAAIQLTNLLYDSGLDPYSDLKELQGTITQVTSLLQSLPNSPQAQQVKDTVGAIYTSKVGQALIKKIPQITNQGDPGMDRMQTMMDRYMPMIIAMNAMTKMGNMGAEPAAQPQPTRPAAAEIPPEIKEKMDNMEKQLMETQNLLREQAEEKKQREHDERLISLINAGVTPQIAALQTQLESLNSTIAANQAAQPARQETSAEMAAITRQIEEFKGNLIQKEKTGLNLTDLETVMGTIETLEKRLKRDVPAGEFDWRATTMSTLGEIGKEAINAFRDIQAQKQPQYSPAPQPSTQAPGADRKQIAVQKLQNYIMANLQKQPPVTTLIMEEAQRALNLTSEEIVAAYEELKKLGWVRDKGPPAATQQQSTPPPPAAMASQQTPNQPPPQSTNTGGQSTDKFSPDAPFLER